MNALLEEKQLKSIQLKWSAYCTISCIAMYLILAPLVLAYLNEIYNFNNSDHSYSIITKHFVKVSSTIAVLIYLINIPFIFLGKLGRSLYAFLLFTTLCIAAIIDFLHVILYKTRANASSYFSIYATNGDETLEFISDYSTFHLFTWLFAFLLVPAIIVLLYRWIKHTAFTRISIVAFVICFLPVSYVAYTKSSISYLKELSAFRLSSSYFDYKREVEVLNDSFGATPVIRVEKSTVQDKETYIIVLGESTSKFHMQLYGYERNTNPKLSALKNELTVFKQVKSSHVHTIEAIKDMLVLKDSSDDFTKYSLIDCFNEAGFSTYWLSNQIYIGENETIVSAIAKRAHKRIFINPLGGNKFDEEILPELSDILKDNENKKVVFIHLMGTHLSYQNRYPNEFDVFKTEEKSLFGDHADSYINHYDNAILYNDYVISEVIDKAKSESGLCAVVYSSDHGDEVYDFRDFHGHSQELLSKYMQSVPFLIWSNKSFKRKRGEVLTNATNNSEMPFTLNNLPHSIQELFGVKSEYYNASRSFFAEKGVKSEESPDEIFHSETLQALPAYASRIWVHRVNSLERLNYVQDKFDGMELDIVYENGVLDVRHPPAKSIHLSLDIYFSNVNNITSHYFWLDLKNLTKQNVKEVIERLNYLRDKYGIKDNLVLETNNARCIPEMRDTGFYTSYYIANLAYLSGDEQKKEIEKIAAEIAMYKLDVISQSVDNYRLMKEYFPYSQKLVWALNLNWNDSTVHDRIKTLLENDTSIKISLVNYETGGWK